MCKALSLSIAVAMISLLLSGCSSTLPSGSSSSGMAAPVSLTMTDDPPAGVSVLFFQVSLTNASLIPASGPAVSLLGNNTPIQIDVTKLQALSAFLSTASVPAGNYSSLSLTFADPQLVIYNGSDQSIAGTCAVGSVCQLTPAVDSSATATLSAAPFPVTVVANSPLGFLVDFHLNTIIQSDLSVDLGVANGITLAQAPPANTEQPAPFGILTGTVGTVSGNQFTLTTTWGKTFTIDTNSNTSLIDWPPCVSPGALACLTAGQIVRVRVASVESNGNLLAAAVIWLQAANQQTVEGTVIGFNATQIRLIIHNEFASRAAVPFGGEATVTLDKGATYSVDSGGFTIPSEFIFRGFNNLAFGQNLQVAVDPGSMSCAISNVITKGGWGPPPVCTFTTNNVQLEPSQLSVVVTSIDSSTPSFTLNSFPSISFGPVPPISAQGLMVDATTQTSYQGFTPDNFSALADDDFVSVSGWIFETDNGILDPAISPPAVLAQTVTLHAAGIY